MDDNPSTWRDFELRLKTRELLIRWGVAETSPYRAMMDLFGIKMGIREDWTPEIMEDMRKLHGPYGKVVYQMIKAKYHDNR